MDHVHTAFTALTHAIAHTLASLTNRSAIEHDEPRDRGAVSLEQVLWFVAAGVSVAVIAGILWSQIRAQASSPVSTPSAP